MASMNDQGAYPHSGPQHSKGARPRVPPDYGYASYGQGSLFDDTSVHHGQQSAAVPPTGYGENPMQPVYDQGFTVQQMMANPVASMAMQYGQTLAGQGKAQLDAYVSVKALKHYFAVDTGYVVKKLGLLLFPFVHKDWSLQYQEETVACPRSDINALDLYIPAMSVVTYILTAGYMLGVQSRFSPEQLGILASSLMVWLVIEVLAIQLALYILTVSSKLHMFDVVAVCSYKFVCMIGILLGGLVLKKIGYYGALIYFSLSLGFFLLRTLRTFLLARTDHYTQNRNSHYLLLGICIIQPLLMYWLTRHLVVTSAPV